MLFNNANEKYHEVLIYYENSGDFRQRNKFENLVFNGISRDLFQVFFKPIFPDRINFFPLSF